MREKVGSIDDMLRIAKQVQPNLWRRTEQVARIIDPSAFCDDWVCDNPDQQELHHLKLKYMQSNAMCRAQEVLKVLGVNTDTDWYEILTRMAKAAK